jgi:predicted anti-sigma-YlaC factor YlaD
MTQWITCRQVVDFLDEYLAGALTGEQLDEFEYHLSSCPPCINYIKTYQESVLLGKRALEPADAAPPEEVPDRLLRAILEARRR